MSNILAFLALYSKNFIAFTPYIQQVFFETQAAVGWVESMGGIILRTSLLDTSVRLSPHSAPDNLSFRVCSCGCNHGMIRVQPKDCWLDH
jgi:hypothetical protein